MLKTIVNKSNGRLTITTEDGNIFRIKESLTGGVILTSVGKDIKIKQEFSQSICINFKNKESETKPIIIKENKIVGVCPVCNSNLVERNGSRGKFYGCSSYPECNHTESIYVDSYIVDEEDETYESKYGTIDDLGDFGHN